MRQSIVKATKQKFVSAYTWALRTEGSSRSSAIIRIGLVLLIWARWGETLALHNDPNSLLLICFKINFFLATITMLVGWYARTSTAWTALTLLTLYYYGGFFLDLKGLTNHHMYLLAAATALCALTPCGASYSLDRLLAVFKAERENRHPPPESGNLWGLRLMTLQLSTMYLWTAVDKTNVGFLSGERLESIFMLHHFDAAHPEAPIFHVLMAILAVFVVLLDYTLAFGLPFSATRRWLIVPGLLYHGILYMMVPVATFSATVALLYLSCVNANAVHRCIDRLHGYRKNATSHAIPSQS